MTGASQSKNLLILGIIIITGFFFLQFNWPPIEFESKILENRAGLSQFQINITEAISWNQNALEHVFDDNELPCDPDNVTEVFSGWVDEKNVRCQSYSNGTLKILILGNSVSYKAFPFIHKVLKGRYKELRLFTKGGSPPLSDENPKFTAAAHAVVEKMQPDIIWNLHSQIYEYLVRPFTNPKADQGYQEFQRNLDFYKTRTKHFIIDLPYYWTKTNVSYEIIDRLGKGLFLNDLKISRSLAEPQQKDHKARLLALKCDNCLYHDVEKFLWQDDGFYWFYNRANGHGYTRDGVHLTPEFLEKLIPMYSETIDKLLANF